MPISARRKVFRLSEEIGVEWSALRVQCCGLGEGREWSRIEIHSPDSMQQDAATVHHISTCIECSRHMTEGVSKPLKRA